MDETTVGMAQHTPGPWTHKPRARDGHCDLIEYRGRAFIQVGVPYKEQPILDYPHENQQTANARLIAAAPDLLAALKALLFNQLHGNGLEAHYKAQEAARAAIAAATGTD